MVITGETNMARFRALQVIHGLALEINSGMKLSSRGSVMKVGKQLSGSKRNTKKGVLADMVVFLQSIDPGYEPRESVTKALGL